MDRRTITAVVLIILFMMIYPTILEKFFPNLYKKTKIQKTKVINKEKNNQQLISENKNEKISASEEKSENKAEELILPHQNTEERLITLKALDSQYTFSTIGAGIKKINIPKYCNESITSPDDYLLQIRSINKITGLNHLSYKPEKINEKEITFKAAIPKTGLEITKTILPGEKKYLLEVIITLKNKSDKKFYMEQGPVISIGTLNEHKNRKNRFAIIEATALDIEGNIQRVSKKSITGSVWTDLKYKWVGIQGITMCYILQNDNSYLNGWNYEKRIEVEQEKTKLIKKEIIKSYARLPEQNIPPHQKITYKLTYYAGPKLYYHLASIGNDFNKIINFGTILSPISRFIIWGLNILYKIFKNYGICIIILTIIIKIILYPLTKSSMVSMKKMKELQPQMEEIREKYKDNPQKMNQEIFALYKKHKVNPVSGCFPIFLQIPIFFAFYKTLINAVELKGAHFLWIKDLSLPDTIIHIGSFPVNALPIIMGITQLISQKQTSTDKKQEQIIYFMTIFMLMIFYNMPSGLVLYWLVSNIVSIVQQWMINKHTNK